MPESPQSVYRQPKEGMGCLAKGCLTLVILAMVLGALLSALLYAGYRSVRPFIADSPVAVRVYPATQAEDDAVHQKLAAFREAVYAGRAATIEVTPDELNVLIADDPDFADLRGKLYLSLDHGDLAADTSIPLGESNSSWHGRVYYLNAHTVMDIAFENGEWTLRPRRVEVGHRSLPGWMMQIVSGESFQRGINDGYKDAMNRNPKVSVFIRRLHSVHVQDGRIVVTADGAAPPPGDRPAVATPPEAR